LDKQQKQQPSRAYGAEEEEAEDIYTGGHLLASVNTQTPVQQRFGRAECRIKEGGFPLEHPDEIKAHWVGQAENEGEKNDIFQPAHKIVNVE
jgi:hypothetical protein